MHSEHTHAAVEAYFRLAAAVDGSCVFVRRVDSKIRALGLLKRTPDSVMFAMCSSTFFYAVFIDMPAVERQANGCPFG